MEAGITELQEDLKGLALDLEEKTKEVERVKKIANRSAKVLDQLVKEIAGKVRRQRGKFRTVLMKLVYRTMRLRSLALNVPRSTVLVDWRKSSCLSLQVV